MLTLLQFYLSKMYFNTAGKKHQGSSSESKVKWQDISCGYMWISRSAEQDILVSTFTLLRKKNNTTIKEWGSTSVRRVSLSITHRADVLGPAAMWSLQTEAWLLQSQQSSSGKKCCILKWDSFEQKEGSPIYNESPRHFIKFSLENNTANKLMGTKSMNK